MILVKIKNWKKMMKIIIIIIRIQLIINKMLIISKYKIMQLIIP
jgi:hypothetical protein